MNFSCDKCNQKVPFWETLKIDKNHVTICHKCGTKLYPIRTKSFNWGFFVGFLAVVIPGEITYRLTQSLGYTLIVALSHTITAVFGVALYTYKTTSFTSNF